MSDTLTGGASALVTFRVTGRCEAQWQDRIPLTKDGRLDELEVLNSIRRNSRMTRAVFLSMDEEGLSGDVCVGGMRPVGAFAIEEGGDDE